MFAFFKSPKRLLFEALSASLEALSKSNSVQCENTSLNIQQTRNLLLALSGAKPSVDKLNDEIADLKDVKELLEGQIASLNNTLLEMKQEAAALKANMAAEASNSEEATLS